MSETMAFLKDLEFYCKNENGLEEKKDKNRIQYNFKRIVNELRTHLKDEEIKQKYTANIQGAKTLVSSFGIVHTTNLASLMSIIQSGGLISIQEMDKRDISFNYRISFRGIDEQMHNFVFGATQEGDAIYGLYEIKLKKEVEGIKDALFMPKSFLEYGADVVKDYFMDIKYWRHYLAEEIAINTSQPSDYIKSTPAHLRPEFLFPQQIPISYFESITCLNQKAYDELTSLIKKEFGETKDILRIIKVKSNN